MEETERSTRGLYAWAIRRGAIHLLGLLLVLYGTGSILSLFLPPLIGIPLTLLIGFSLYYVVVF